VFTVSKREESCGNLNCASTTSLKNKVFELKISVVSWFSPEIASLY